MDAAFVAAYNERAVHPWSETHERLHAAFATHGSQHVFDNMVDEIGSNLLLDYVENIGTPPRAGQRRSRDEYEEDQPQPPLVDLIVRVFVFNRLAEGDPEVTPEDIAIMPREDLEDQIEFFVKDRHLRKKYAESFDALSEGIIVESLVPEAFALTKKRMGELLDRQVDTIKGAVDTFDTTPTFQYMKGKGKLKKRDSIAIGWAVVVNKAMEVFQHGLETDRSITTSVVGDVSILEGAKLASKSQASDDTYKSLTKVMACVQVDYDFNLYIAELSNNLRKQDYDHQRIYTFRVDKVQRMLIGVTKLSKFTLNSLAATKIDPDIYCKHRKLQRELLTTLIEHLKDFADSTVTKPRQSWSQIRDQYQIILSVTEADIRAGKFNYDFAKLGPMWREHKAAYENTLLIISARLYAGMNKIFTATFSVLIMAIGSISSYITSLWSRTSSMTLSALVGSLTGTAGLVYKYGQMFAEQIDLKDKIFPGLTKALEFYGKLQTDARGRVVGEKLISLLKQDKRAGKIWKAGPDIGMFKKAYERIFETEIDRVLSWFNGEDFVPSTIDFPKPIPEADRLLWTEIDISNAKNFYDTNQLIGYYQATLEALNYGSTKFVELVFGFVTEAALFVPKLLWRSARYLYDIIYNAAGNLRDFARGTLQSVLDKIPPALNLSQTQIAWILVSLAVGGSMLAVISVRNQALHDSERYKYIATKDVPRLALDNLEILVENDTEGEKLYEKNYR